MAEHDQLEITSAEQLGAWLQEHHDRADGVWVVTRKKATGDGHVPYDAIVREALRFGWIDSTGRKLDDRRSQLHLTPRNPRSNWSAANKRRVEELLAAGRMHPAGLAAVEQAKASGTWNALDEVEALREPADLAAALDAVPDARAEWDAFPRSTRRAILEWVASAKRQETRARRIAETAEKAAVGVRANQWRQPKGRG